MSLIGTMLESTCDIEKEVISRDSAGGVTQEFQVVSSDIPCSQQEAGAGVKMLYGQRNAFVTTVLYFAEDPDVNPNNRIICSDMVGNITTYLALGQAQPNGRGRLWSVDCERIRQPE